LQGILLSVRPHARLSGPAHWLQPASDSWGFHIPGVDSCQIGLIFLYAAIVREENAWIPMIPARLQVKAAKPHPLEWLLEPLETQDTYIRRKMFGCEAVYLNGRLVIILAVGDEPWNGLLVATSHEHHPALEKQWPRLESHPVLGKWLYVSQQDTVFESTATGIVQQILKSDPRIGVEPKPKKRKRKNL